MEPSNQQHSFIVIAARHRAPLRRGAIPFSRLRRGGRNVVFKKLFLETFFQKKLFPRLKQKSGVLSQTTQTGTVCAAPIQRLTLVLPATIRRKGGPALASGGRAKMNESELQALKQAFSGLSEDDIGTIHFFVYTHTGAVVEMLIAPCKTYEEGMGNKSDSIVQFLLC